MAGRKAIAGSSPPKPKKASPEAKQARKAKNAKNAKINKNASSRHTMIGRGLCRGPNWQIGKKWPKDEGFETLEDCSKECEKRPGCTGFELTPSEDLKNKFRCILFGHDGIEVCFSMRNLM